MKKHFIIYLFLMFLFLVPHKAAQAQNCVDIVMDDTVAGCTATLNLSASLIVPPGVTVVDTQWSPLTGLTGGGTLTPTITSAAGISIYTLTIKSFSPVNLVVNGDFSAGNTGFTSDYIYGTGGPWGLLSNEGQYAISTNPYLTHTGFSSFPDHTTGTGNMMVVNGAFTANISVWCQTITVQPNSEYDFSAWAASAHSSNPAELQFSINGVLLGSSLALSDIPGQWEQFHEMWNSGSNTTATICIVNQSTAAGGNDFVLDDIMFREICSASDSVYIDRKPADLTMAPHILACAQILLDGQYANEAPGTVYTWSLGDGVQLTGDSVTHSYDTAGPYEIILYMEDINGCKDTISQWVDVTAPLDITISPDTSICPYGEARLLAQGGILYSWTPESGLSSTTIADPAAKPLNSTSYTVSVIDDRGCTGTATTRVEIKNREVETLRASSEGAPITCSNKSAQLHVTGGGTYIWSPASYFSDITSADPIVTIVPPVTTEFTVSTIDYRGCYDSVSVTVFADPEPGVFVPDAFTPNQDGRNDLMRPVVYCDYSIYFFRIFNRWGEQVYTGDSRAAGWDGMYKGEPQPIGTYTYLLEGSAGKGSVYYRGTFTLVR